jgi:hypothetical protein
LEFVAMMQPRTVRVVTVLIVVVFVAVTVLSMLPSAASAAEPVRPSTEQTSAGQTSAVQTSAVQTGRQASTVQSKASALARARAKAVVARKGVKKAAKMRVRAVAAAADPARAYEAAVGVQARASAAVTETQTALERANAVLASEAAVRADITARYEAGRVQFEAAAAAYRAAGEQVSVLRAAQDGLVKQLGEAYAAVEVVAGAAAAVELVQVPAAAGAVTAAWKAEQKARGVRVRVKEGWEDKRKAAGRCRPVTKAGKAASSWWECLTGGKWRASKSLTSAAKRKEKAGRDYRKAKKARVGQEKHLAGLKALLAAKRAELAGVEATAKDLDGQVAVGRTAVSAAEQEASRLRVVADEWDKTLDGIVAEEQKLTAETNAARSQQPGLAAAIAPLTAEVTAAQAQVAAAQGAHTVAQSRVVEATKAVERAKKKLAKAVKKVKALSRR